MTAANY